MGVFTDKTKITTVISPVRLFQSCVLDADNLIPKVAPQAIKSIEIIEGNGGPGTVKKINFDEGRQFKYAKLRVDEIFSFYWTNKLDGIDHANFSYSYTVIEGDVLSDILEKINYKIKIIASPNGGSILKIISKYHTKGDNELKEEEIKAGKEMASGLFRAVEDYLLGHPDTYNIF